MDSEQIDWTRVWAYVAVSVFLTGFWLASVMVLWEWTR